MSITRAGLRKLEQRLVYKRLLTVAGARHVIQVPGLRGHFVPDSGASKNAQKVAAPASKTTQAGIKPLVVPAELVSFNYLMASEKVLLAYYAGNPGAQNERVLAALGVSLSGLKKLKRGLIEKHVLVPTGAGYTIRLPGYVLVRDSQGSHFISESEAVKNGYKITLPAPKLTPAGDIYDEWLSFLDHYLRPDRDAKPSSYQEQTARMIKQIEAESPEGPEREAVLRLMKERENFYFALQFVYDNIPRKHEANYAKLVNRATPEQLATLRERIEGMMLAGIPEPKQLGMVTGAITQMAQPETQTLPASGVARRKRGGGRA